MSKILLNKSLKRAGPSMANASVSAAKKQSREKVVILEDAWLEALKSLTCLKWAKMRLVSRQLNGLVGRNVSCLPLGIIDSVEMKLEQREKTENKIFASDSIISPNHKIQWFKDRGITLNQPADIDLNNAIIGLDFTEKHNDDSLILFLPGSSKDQACSSRMKAKLLSRSVDMHILGDTSRFNASVLFKAEFSPDRNRFSWPSMAYFLKLIYDQSTFAKELSMYALDKNLKEILFSGKEQRFIRCGFFKLLVADCDEVCEPVSWMGQNVQADKIEIDTFIDYGENENCVAVSNFLLGPSWISASQEVDLGHVNELKDFFRILIKKFRTLSDTQSTFPIITFSGTRFLGSIADGRIKKLLSGNGKLDDSDDDDFEKQFEKDDKSEDSGDEINDKVYTISNGEKQMRVEFVKEPPRLPRVFKCPSCRGGKNSEFDIRVTVETRDKNAIG